jgi:hypothetical protein
MSRSRMWTGSSISSSVSAARCTCRQRTATSAGLAVVADPQTATLVLVKGLKYGDPDAEPGGLGRVCWHELFAADAKATFEFYGRLLGWQKAEPMTTDRVLSALRRR